MKTKAFPALITRITIIGLLMVFASCSHTANTPAPQQTMSEILVQSGTWYTTGATLVQADGTSLTLNGTDPFLKTILLYNVTFYADGTATDTNDPNGLTKDGLTWKLTGAHLLVNLNHNNTDKVDATISFLNDYKLILNVTDFYNYNGVTYVQLVQTFGH